jgi:nitrogen fixation protein NifZ
MGQRVRVKKPIRNDGSNPFEAPDAILIKPGAEGYVKHIGDFLQVLRIYEVHFIEEGHTFGCRESELEAADEYDGYDEVEEELRWIREHRAKKAAEKAARDAQSQKEGE